MNSISKLVKYENTEGSPSRRIPSMKKTVKNINYKNKISLKAGIDATIKWYLN